LNHQLQQSALLGGWLLLKQLGCLARQAQCIYRLLDRRRRGLPNLLNLAQLAILLASPLGGALVEELSGDAAIELVQLRRLDPLDRPLARACSVRSDSSTESHHIANSISGSCPAAVW
jgi:hypothetical protein